MGFLIASGLGSRGVLDFVSRAGALEIRHGDMPIADRPGKPGAEKPPRQIPAGLAGPFIVDSREQHGKTGVDYVAMLQEWRMNSRMGKTWPAMPAMSEPNFFTINGKAFPVADTITVKKGERVRIRLIEANQFAQPMNFHGFPFKIVATDGFPVPTAARLTKDTVMVSPGERYDIEFVAGEPGGLIMTIKAVG